MLLRLRWTFFLLTLTLTVYYLNTGNSPAKNYYARRSEVKRVVTFSLLKQIEVEGQRVACEGGFAVRGGKREVDRGWVRVPETEVFVYGVFYDHRLEPFGYLRVLAMVKDTWNKPLYCQTHSPTDTYDVTRAKTTKIWNDQWNSNEATTDYYTPVLLSCQVRSNATDFLYLNANPCEINGVALKVSSTSSHEEGASSVLKITVCVKPLVFPRDVSERLLQWIVMIQLLGADKIDFYIQDVHRNVLNLLQWLRKRNPSVTVKQFQNLGRVSKKSHTYSQRIWQKRRNELVAYNDCFYRNLRTSGFVVPLDVDEIIVPRKVGSWRQLLEQVTSENLKAASFGVRNAYYLRSFMHDYGRVAVSEDNTAVFFKHFVRSEMSAPEESGKSFVSTEDALTVFNHYALRSLRPEVAFVRFLAAKDVQMNHYKDECDVRVLPECGKYVESRVRFVDRVVFRFRGKFEVRYRNISAGFVI